jgi:hypothetical protein
VYPAPLTLAHTQEVKEHGVVVGHDKEVDTVVLRGRLEERARRPHPSVAVAILDKQLRLGGYSLKIDAPEWLL